MFEFNADTIVNTLWDSLRPSRHDSSITRRFDKEVGEYQIEEPGLVVTMDLRFFHHGLGGDEYKRSALVHTILTANTSVFQAVSTDWKRWDEVALGDYYNYSNHDSCWRTDGMRGFDTLFFGWAEELNKEIQGHGSGGLKPYEFRQYCTLGSLGGKPWEFIEVEHRKIPDEYHRRELLGLERRK